MSLQEQNYLRFATVIFQEGRKPNNIRKKLLNGSRGQDLEILAQVLVRRVQVDNGQTSLCIQLNRVPLSEKNASLIYYHQNSDAHGYMD